MNPRPKHALLGLAVLGVLLAGCSSPQPDAQPVAGDITTTDATTAPAREPTTEPVTVSPAQTIPLVQTTPPKPAASPKPKPKPTTARPKPKPTKKPAPKPTTKPPSGQQGVHPGAFCTPEGATGFTSKGTKMRCTRKPGEDRARWRKA